MISVTNLRAGTTFEDNGQIFQVLSYEHIKMGRGSANIKVKAKNLRSGATVEKSFISGAQVKPISLTKKNLQFLYKDERMVYFMDPHTFAQMAIPLSIISQEEEFLKDSEMYAINCLDDEPLSLVLPPKMDFRVVETGPSLRGNSATNIYKDAVLENGLRIKVPLFINVEDRVRIDTRTKTYSEKVAHV